MGLRTTPADLTLEVVNFGALDSGAGASNSLVHTLTIGMRTRGAHQAARGVGVSLSTARNAATSWILSLGYHYAPSSARSEA